MAKSASASSRLRPRCASMRNRSRHPSVVPERALTDATAAAQVVRPLQSLIVMIGAKTMRSGRRRLLAACAACMAVAVVTISHSVWVAELPDADALMLRLMARDNVPGAALALIKDGNIVLEHGYGFRDLAAAAPVTTATLFNIGSISKSFTALGVAELVDSSGSSWTRR